MMTPRERYQRDPAFARLVKTVYASLERCEFTPTELREAVILAAIMQIEHRGSPNYLLRAEMALFLDAKGGRG